MSGTANVVRIYAHRRLTPKLDEYRHPHRKPFYGRSSRPTSYLRSYAAVFYWFTLGHGIFLVAILEGLSRNAPDVGSFIGIDPAAVARAFFALGVLAAGGSWST